MKRRPFLYSCVAAVIAGAVSVTPAAAAWDGVDVTTDVSYGPDETNKLDVFQGDGKRPMPILVFIPGGGFIGGDKAPYPNIGRYFARHGMIEINANYGVAPQHKWPAAAADVGKVIAWVKANAERYGGNPKRIFLMGHSSGATHVASYAFDRTLHPSDGPGIVAAILLSSRYRVSEEDRQRANVMAYFGEDASQYPARSPITHINDSSLPLFLGIAEGDPPHLAVPTFELAAAVCRRDKKCPRLFWLKGHDHGEEVSGFTTKDEELGLQILDFIGSIR
jgi:acetyl esterase